MAIPGVGLISFTVPGQPQGKARARSGKGGRHYTPAKTRAYEALVAAKCAPARIKAKPMEGPVSVIITAYRARPKSAGPKHECRAGRVRRVDYMGREYRYCTAKPDADNLAKAILDGMTQARAWGDDDQVVILKVIKLWCAEGDEPRVDVDATEVGS